MYKMMKLARFLLIGFMVVTPALMVGCTKKPEKEDISKLEEARAAAESAERKLSELRQERIRLEQELQEKQSELKSDEQERDNLQK
ncbi:MAG: hypothetical protein JXA71_19960 [Chitinispirillaceae bacterium]|nr:hypothetical protein [Chitinispirillaceae bacterium]